MTRDEAWKLAEHWIAAWNARDLDLILAHYEDAIELTSPVAAQLLGTADGKVIGKANGVLGEWKSCTSCRKLQCSEVVILHIRES